jgi:hypothetical protein
MDCISDERRTFIRLPTVVFATVLIRPSEFVLVATRFAKYPSRDCKQILRPTSLTCHDVEIAGDRLKSVDARKSHITLSHSGDRSPDDLRSM